MEHDHQAATSEVETHSAGSILRRCREFSHISIEEAAEATKIGKNYLRALEDNRFQDLPSPAYLKGFLKTYATYLGLQTEELIQLVAQQENAFPAEAQKTEQMRQAVGGFSWQRLVLPAVLLGGLIISAIIMAPPPLKRPKPSAVQQPLQDLPVATATTAVQLAHSSVKTVPADVAGRQEAVLEQPPEPTILPSKPRDGFMIRMKVNRNSSLAVVIDDAGSQGYDLTSGDLIEWKASRTIALELTDAGSVDIELNGKPIKLQVPAGKPAYIILDANGIKQ
ncbi:MAG: helix-turn-helix domain-containing protein [Trichlorobacter sp.]|uniref:helix-turn-helix domain-containing protein n=1 Tax=Trichlorobacter sp. TaxID=2911007 RepID=UPI0025635AF3|nr:helix-turn-helix domain-containing protein [Trichlorobacter sp.]